MADRDPGLEATKLECVQRRWGTGHQHSSCGILGPAASPGGSHCGRPPSMAPRPRNHSPRKAQAQCQWHQALFGRFPRYLSFIRTPGIGSLLSHYSRWPRAHELLTTAETPSPPDRLAPAGEEGLPPLVSLKHPALAPKVLTLPARPGPDSKS